MHRHADTDTRIRTRSRCPASTPTNLQGVLGERDFALLPLNSERPGAMTGAFNARESLIPIVNQDPTTIQRHGILAQCNKHACHSGVQWPSKILIALLYCFFESKLVIDECRLAADTCMRKHTSYPMTCRKRTPLFRPSAGIFFSVCVTCGSQA